MSTWQASVISYPNNFCCPALHDICMCCMHNQTTGECPSAGSLAIKAMFVLEQHQACCHIGNQKPHTSWWHVKPQRSGGRCAGEMVRTARGPMVIVLHETTGGSSSSHSSGSQPTFAFQKVSSCLSLALPMAGCIRPMRALGHSLHVRPTSV